MLIVPPTISSAILTTFSMETKPLVKILKHMRLILDHLQKKARMITDKIKMLSSETAIRYMEDDLIKIEKEMEVKTTTE